MASFQTRGKRVRANVWKYGVRISASFDSVDEARAWATDRELELKRERAPYEADDALLKADEIVRSALPRAVTCGVYFLVCGGEIVYVGSSINVERRLLDHAAKSRIAFDAAHILPAERADLRVLESRYIAAFAPKMNRALPGYSEKRRRERVMPIVMRMYEPSSH